MVLALKRSAYSTNIKTRSDFSCAFFDAQLRPVAQGFAQPVHLGSMVEQVPKAVQTFGSGNLGPGDVIVTNDPHPSGVHLNDVSLISPVHVERRAAGLRRQPRASRGRRRRCAGVDRGVPRGLSGGCDHPARSARRGRRHRPGRLQADPGADPLEARDGRGLPRPDRRQRHRRAPGDGAGGASRARDDPRHHGGAPRVHRAADAGRARGAPGGCLRGGGLGRQRRLHRRARAAAGSGRDLGGRRLLRPDGVRPPAARSRQLDVRADVLRVRLRLQVPGRSGPAGQRRLLPARRPARSGRNGRQLHVAGAGRRRLGDARAADRGALPRAAPGLPRAAPRGDEGDDVPGGLRLARRRGRQVHVLLRHVRRRLRRTLRERRPGRRPVEQPEHRERADRGDRAQLPGADHGLSLVENSEGPGRFRGGLGLRKDYRFDLHTTFTVLADRDKAGAVGRVRRARGPRRRVRARPRRRGDAAGLEEHVELVPGDVVSVRSCGGGGYGPPEEREPERVLRDVLEGKVSAERARARSYRVGDEVRRPRVGATRRATAEASCGTWQQPAHERPRRGRHRRHVHRRHPRRRGVGQRRDREGADHARRPVGRLHGSGRARARRGGRARRRRQLRRPRDDGRDERDHRGQDRAQRLRHDRGLPRPARDRPPGAADALRHPVREGEAARAARPGGRGRASASARPARCWWSSTTRRCARRPR